MYEAAHRIHTHCQNGFIYDDYPIYVLFFDSCMAFEFAYRLSSWFQKPGTNEWKTTTTTTTTTVSSSAALNSALIHKNDSLILCLLFLSFVCCLPNASLMILWLIFCFYTYHLFLSALYVRNVMWIVAVMVSYVMCECMFWWLVFHFNLLILLEILRSFDF